MKATLQFVVTFVIVVAVGTYLLRSGALGEIGRSWSEGRAARGGNEQKLSDVAGRADGAGGLVCPHCGGSQFKVSRKLSTKLAFGAVSLLGQAKHVVCVTCGTRYRRG